MAVSQQDIVNSARKLLGAPYRVWELGDPSPTWQKDNAGAPPPVKHLMRVGVTPADLINFALGDNGLPPLYGTKFMPFYLVDRVEFDLNAQHQLGAVAIRRYRDPTTTGYGNVALYAGEHELIQVLPNFGVTDKFTDQQLYELGDTAHFDWYGLLQGVNYTSSGQSEAPTPSGGQSEAPTPSGGQSETQPPS